jgi:hypothetical protein
MLTNYEKSSWQKKSLVPEKDIKVELEAWN